MIISIGKHMWDRHFRSYGCSTSIFTFLFLKRKWFRQKMDTKTIFVKYLGYWPLLVQIPELVGCRVPIEWLESLKGWINYFSLNEKRIFDSNKWLKEPQPSGTNKKVVAEIHRKFKGSSLFRCPLCRKSTKYLDSRL